MGEFAKEIQSVNIEDELKQSYLDYAMSVIVGRALPDVCDGLKPVHRRALFAMRELGNDWNKPYKKSARVVGDVIGKYHPHGESAVYDTIVRMAQPFSMRYLLVDGQGNFGSVDGDMPAAMRYTEVRMSKFAHNLLMDLEKDTVDFAPNYDETEFMPTVMPTRVPNLLVNGASGIAVGMATNIPPHNLTEVINGCLALLDDPHITIDGLIEHIPGPDFPTRAIINGRAGIVEAYKNGRGRIYVRAAHTVETDERTKKESIVVTEIPYQVNKARLIEKIAELVKDKKIEGISGLRDESDKDGMRIVVELKRNENPDVILNNLYAQTQLQSVFGINMVALIDGQPKTFNLKQILEAFLKHRRVVVNRRTHFELRKARNRAHLLEGLAVALANIDPVIQAIKQAKNPQAAKAALLERLWAPGLVTELLARQHIQEAKWNQQEFEGGIQEGGYQLSAQQAQAILDLKLHRLTGLEQDKIISEYKELIEEIKRLMDILTDPLKLIAVVRKELEEVQQQFGDSRRTQIQATQHDLSCEDLISEEDRVVTLSHAGYIKAQPIELYSAQKRGGRGKAAASVKEEDYIDQLLIANTHDTLLCFSSRGKVYWLKVYQIPLGSRSAKGRPMVNLLPLEEGERISAILSLKKDQESAYIFMATSSGYVKKVESKEFSRPRSTGLIAIDLVENDELVGVETTDGQRTILLFSNEGKCMRFEEKNVRSMGRGARGVRGIKLSSSGRIISLVVAKEGNQILTATENGFGKRTVLDEFPVRGRGGQGVIAIQTSQRNGQMVGAVQVEPEDEVMLISSGGTLVRIRASEVSTVGRNTQGVRLINLNDEETLVGLQPIQEIEKSSQDEDLNTQGSDDAKGDHEDD